MSPSTSIKWIDLPASSERIASLNWRFHDVVLVPVRAIRHQDAGGDAWEATLMAMLGLVTMVVRQLSDRRVSEAERAAVAAEPEAFLELAGLSHPEGVSSRICLLYTSPSPRD